MTTSKTTKAPIEPIATTQPPSIPTVQLPRPLALLGTALSQSRDGFAEVWAYERENEIGLQALKLLAKAAKGIGAPLVALGLYAGASAVGKLTGEDAKTFATQQWARLQGKLSNDSATEEDA